MQKGLLFTSLCHNYNLPVTHKKHQIHQEEKFLYDILIIHITIVSCNSNNSSTRNVSHTAVHKMRVRREESRVNPKVQTNMTYLDLAMNQMV